MAGDRNRGSAPGAVVLLLLVALTHPLLSFAKQASGCDLPWYVSSNLTISWLGDDREGVVVITATTKDTFGRACSSNETMTVEFKQREAKVPNPCSNALYQITITVPCGQEVKRQHNTVRTPPDAPEIKPILNFTNTSILLEWNAPPGSISSYTARAVDEQNKTLDVKTPKTTVEFTDLRPFTRYVLSVSAYSDAGDWSGWSKAKLLQTTEGVPFPPQNLTATFIKTDEIGLEWEEPTPETGPILWYEVRWSEAGSSLTQKTDNTSLVLRGLLPFTDYFVQVRAATVVGEGLSTSTTLKTALAVPEPPTLQCHPTNVTISVSWVPACCYRGPNRTYTLRYKAKDASSTYLAVEIEDPLTLDYVLTGLKPFTVYELQMRARNDAGVGRWSETAEVQTLIGIPTAPRNLKVLSQSSTYISIEWDVPEPANNPLSGLKYQVNWGKKQEPSVIETTGETRFQALSLSPYTDYVFKVRAESDAGIGEWTSVLEVRTNVGIPSEPLNVTEREVTNTTVLITWEPPLLKNGPSVTYVVKWDLKEEDDWNATSKNDSSSRETDPVGETLYEIRGLHPYTNYSVQVCCETTAGRGPFAEPILVETLPGIPGVPSVLRVSDVQPTSLNLQWDPPDHTNGPLTGYVMQWGVAGTSGSQTRTEREAYRALGLRPYTDYFFRVAAETVGGVGPYITFFQKTDVSIPSEPRSLSSSDITHSSILLEWSPPEHPNAPALQYTLQWRRSNVETTFQVHETNATGFRLMDLVSSTNYSVRVCAESSVGKGPWTPPLYVFTREKDRSSAVIAGSVVGALVVIFAIGGAVMLRVVRKRGGLKAMFRTAQPTQSSSDTLQSEVSLQMEVMNDSSRIPVRNFDRHVLQLVADNYQKLSQEFERVVRNSPAFPSDEAKKSENLTKNRWVKILPFDHSRVKLLTVGDEVEPDFINASYVPGEAYLLEYIATQGPLPNTVDDFWRMVWQQSVFLIVMLTQCTERAKRTCEKYWPGPSEDVQYGGVKVQTLSESITQAYVVRLFRVSQGGHQRHVVHLHYQSWPVSGCPKSPDDFLSFVRTVRGQMTSATTGPMLVHCSAGIGRTGTFIAVDRLWKQVECSCEEVDVHGTVLDLRRYRPSMVQTEEQYYFIHLCLQRIIQEKRMELECDYGEGIYSN